MPAPHGVRLHPGPPLTRLLRPAAFPLASHLLAHIRLLLCALAGVLAAVLWPNVETELARVLLGWNVLVWCYLAWVAVIVGRAEQGHVKRLALAQAESAAIVLAIVIVASIISLVAVILEIKAAKSAGSREIVSHIVFAFATVIGSWLLLPTLFGLSYASMYYRREPRPGPRLPGCDRGLRTRPHRLSLLLLHHRRHGPDIGRGGDDARDAAPGDHPVGALVRLQHDDPGFRDQHRGRSVLGPFGQQ